jgi:uncharacterized protein (TIGR02466 family)
MRTELLFATPVWIEDKCGVDADKLKEFAYFVKSEDPKGRQVSNEGGWQSWDFIDDVMKDNALSELRDKIYEIAGRACDEWGFKHYSLKITNSWININGRGAMNRLHTHPGCILSGVYYVDVPKCCSGPITIVRDFKDQQLKEHWGNANNFESWEGMNMNEYDIYPVADNMVLFPSWAMHAVGKSSSDEDRISISFNIIAHSDHYHEIYPTRQHNRE